MLDNTPIKVGDELVEFGKVYKVFKIESKPSFDGLVEEHVFFKPIYDTSDNRTLSCSIPVKNITQANIRRPLEKKKMSEILNLLSTLDASSEVHVLDINEAREILKLNNPAESARVLVGIWKEINTVEDLATKSRRDIFDMSLKNLTQEVAFAYELSLEEAEKKLQKALKKAKKK